MTTHATEHAWNTSVQLLNCKVLLHCQTQMQYLPGEALVPCGHAGPWPKWRAFVLARTALREQIADVLYFRSTPQLGADAGGLFAPERLHGAAHRIAS